MITEEYFLEKISQLAHMKLITITKSVAKDVYPRFSEFETSDLDHAIDKLISSENRFDFTTLLKDISRRRSNRLETQAVTYQNEEALAASRFFNPPRFSGECTRHKCQGCEHSQDCKIRAHEWLKGINTILDLSKKRAPGEGKRMADQLIHHMEQNFNA